MQVQISTPTRIGPLPVPETRQPGRFDTAGVYVARPADLFLLGEEVPNLQKVSDDLYRSAQPTHEGLQYMEIIGMRTVVNLRAFHSDADGIKNTCITHKRIRVKKLYPEKKHIIKFLRLVTNRKRLPVLVHCEFGIHRTGLMCMAYRMVVQGWSKEEALEELFESDFGTHRYWGVIEWMRSVNVETIKERRVKREKIKPQFDLSLLWHRKVTI